MINGIPFVVSAPSGTGKTTACKILRERFPELKFSVSHTTRSPRHNEVDGKCYHFISEATFKDKIGKGEFLEWANVHNNYYGTTIETINAHIKKGEDLLLDLDVQGVQSLRKMSFDGVFIFLLPPSFDELYNRLKKRGTEPPDIIQQRIAVGKKEMAQYQLYDYVVINSNLEVTVDNLIAIIRAERCRATRHNPIVQSIVTPNK